MATDDDAVVEAASVVTAEVVAGNDYAVASGAASAEVTAEDNDEASFTVSAAPDEIAEGESSAVTVAIVNGVTFARDQTITLDFAGSTATKGDDYTVSSETLTLGAGTGSVTVTLTAVDDSDEESDETVSVAVVHKGTTVGTATVTIAPSDEAAEVSIAGGTSPVPEGTAATFVLTRTGAAAEALTVTVSVTETEAMLAANPPSTVAFGAGESSPPP